MLWAGANFLSACLALSATLFYVFIYTLWLKRTSKQNIVIGGAAGAVPVLVGWAAVRNDVTWAPILLFGIMFMWTPPHFWALAIRHIDDYRAANVPMLPVVAPIKTVLRQMLIYTVIMVVGTPGAPSGRRTRVDLRRGCDGAGRAVHRRHRGAVTQSRPAKGDATFRI